MFLFDLSGFARRRIFQLVRNETPIDENIETEWKRSLAIDLRSQLYFRLATRNGVITCAPKFCPAVRSSAEGPSRRARGSMRISRD